MFSNPKPLGSDSGAACLNLEGSRSASRACFYVVETRVLPAVPVSGLLCSEAASLEEGSSARRSPHPRRPSHDSLTSCLALTIILKEWFFHHDSELQPGGSSPTALPGSPAFHK